MKERSLIEVENVKKVYGDKLILKNINLKIDKGEFVTIIGSSGCGKTTFLKLINGLVKPDFGQVYVNNYDISTIDKIALRRGIGYVIQEIGLFPHMNVRKNISYIPNLIKKDSKEKVENKVKELIKVVGLKEDMLDRYPNELSGGQRQRVGIARALASDAKILLMDEPFGAIDEITRRLLQDEILRIYKQFNMTIIFITHDIKEALKLGTRVIVMDKGEIVQNDTPEEVVRNPKTSFVRNLIGA
ncbi:MULTISPECIES: ABC transporter ATP-binding protein [Clostridia]|jgi:osmoprotectant transport system ATP-binding protein|uniref:ABC transporter ATP-binding protein n=1 Tax=Clostridium saudiense TaxID=1414720 RepID=A0ABS2FGN2_9CLOT|nr:MULTISPECIES: ABC transporter ATP-binding protein [Clostridiaceae]MBM6819715.1 ABC transporter ATP-binding protein [Clostridium saudiense]